MRTYDPRRCLTFWAGYPKVCCMRFTGTWSHTTSMAPDDTLLQCTAIRKARGMNINSTAGGTRKTKAGSETTRPKTENCLHPEISFVLKVRTEHLSIAARWQNNGKVWFTESDGSTQLLRRDDGVSWSCQQTPDEVWQAGGHLENRRNRYQFSHDAKNISNIAGYTSSRYHKGH